MGRRLYTTLSPSRAIARQFALICLAATAAAAQQKQPSAEIGTSLGVTIISASGGSITTVGIPVDAGPLPLLARPAIYASIFATPSVMVEPQVAFANISGGSGDDFTFVLVGAQVAYLFRPAQRTSAYVGANAAFQQVSGVGTLNGLGVGGALGYRFRVGSGFAVRLEGRYRRWLNDYDGLNEIGFAIGLGGII